MCGVTGIYAFNDNGKTYLDKTADAAKTLIQRGPDGHGIYTDRNIALGHTRLAVIDPTEAGAQPFSDNTGRYTIVFNGEFYNFREHRNKLGKEGFTFRSASDTEVLLNLYIQKGPSCLDDINGCFAFAVYDKTEETLFIARDRMGINPMLYYLDSDKLIFGSEMKALLAFGIPKKIDTISLYTYLQLNYIPGPATIFENVYKMVPGTYLLIKNGIVRKKKYYRIPEQTSVTMNISYEDAGKKLMELLDAAVQRRLVADVPLGAFLSGGIDSSVIAALAARHSPFINTFSIGYKDEPYFDETHYADLVAKKLNTDHTVFSLTNDDLFENLFKVLDYTDEPFADSSALAVHILSMYTRKKVTVALSGDGADEMFAGYNKHYAHFKARKSGLSAGMIKAGEAIWKRIPQSRNSGIGNKARQLNRFAQGLRLSEKERYWNWCAFTDETTSRELFAGRLDETEYLKRKNKLLGSIGTGDGICDILYTDMHLVLQNDMLTKVDMMSMANSLEVRTPFLDHEVVDFVFSLPEKYKINAGIRKRILQDTFREVLPDELYKRPKQGFEVPLIKWLRTDLRTLITDDLLKESTIREQGLFDPTEIKRMIAKLFSSNPEDIHARIWGLIVFQYWWKKYFL